MNDLPRAWLHDADLGVRCDDAQKTFLALMHRLRRRRHVVWSCPRITSDYPSLDRYHRLVQYQTTVGTLQVDAEWYPAGFSLKGWQSVVVENPNGGRYDFGRLDKMPFLIRIAWLRLVSISRDFLASRGIVIEPPRPSWKDDPLGAFNASWTSHRFSRDATGWPDESVLRSWKQLDHDGVPVRSGESRYLKRDGRWWRVLVYGGINGMWHAIGGPWHVQCGAWELRSCVPDSELKGRRVSRGRAGRSMSSVLARAIESGQYEKANMISRAAALAGIELEVKCQVKDGSSGLDVGPQRAAPVSVARIEAQTKQVRRIMKGGT